MWSGNILKCKKAGGKQGKIDSNRTKTRELLIPMGQSPSSSRFQLFLECFCWDEVTGPPRIQEIPRDGFEVGFYQGRAWSNLGQWEMSLSMAEGGKS